MKLYKIIHPAHIPNFKSVWCKWTVRRTDARDHDAPQLSDFDRKNGCVVLAVEST